MFKKFAPNIEANFEKMFHLLLTLNIDAELDFYNTPKTFITIYIQCISCIILIFLQGVVPNCKWTILLKLISDIFLLI